MQCLDNILDGLDRLKPLWEFLTGVGTVALAILTVYLANKKPKPRIRLTVRVVREHVAIVEMLNAGETLPVVRGWYWSSPCAGRADLLSIVNLTTQGRSVAIPYRMEHGDVLEGAVDLQAIAQLADGRISPDATRLEIEACIATSRFGCVTTIGDVFEVILPVEARAQLGRFINLRRGPN